MTGLGMMMAGGGRTERKRRDDDYYPTPKECTIALMRAEDARMPDHIWEPACGEGAISNVIANCNRQVESTDLVDRGFGIGGKNFLMASELLAEGIVTNPPFNQAAQFIRKAHELEATYIALLLKSTFWHAANRTGLFFRFTPARIYAMTWRPDFTGEGASTMECIWCIWDYQRPAVATEFHLMRHPMTYASGGERLL